MTKYNMKPDTLKYIVPILLSFKFVSSSGTFRTSPPREPLFEESESELGRYDHALDFLTRATSYENSYGKIPSAKFLRGGRKISFSPTEHDPLTAHNREETDEEFGPLLRSSMSMKASMSEHDLFLEDFRSSITNSSKLEPSTIEVAAEPERESDSESVGEAKRAAEEEAVSSARSTNTENSSADASEQVIEEELAKYNIRDSDLYFRSYREEFDDAPVERHHSRKDLVDAFMGVPEFGHWAFSEDDIPTFTVKSSRSEAAIRGGASTATEPGSESKTNSSETIPENGNQTVSKSTISRLFSFSNQNPRIPIIEHREDVRLPYISNEALFGSREKVEFDILVARSLYSEPGDVFVAVADPSYSMIGQLVPLSREQTDLRLFSERIKIDMNRKTMDFHIEKAKKYLRAKYTDADISEFEDNELMKVAAGTIATCSIGKGSTLDMDNVYKLGQAFQRVIFTPRDIFYYPGMLKLALFFNIQFDPNRANGFYDQFIRTFYSGVYGPKRSDLFYITRFQDIPKSLIPDDMIVRSLDPGFYDFGINGAAIKIQELKMLFLNPQNRKNIKSRLGKAEIGYKRLDPVPKTLEDVLDASKIILTKYHSHTDSHMVSDAALDELICNRSSIDHLQGFFLDIFSIEDALHLFSLIVVDFEYKPGYNQYAASYLYAAFLETVRTHGAGSYLIEMGELIEKFREMYQLEIPLKELAKVHRRSENLENVDVYLSDQLSAALAHFLL